MKRTTLSLSLAFAALTLSVAAIGGCKTDQMGVTNTLGSYTTNVDAAPEKTTKAAKKALEELNFVAISVTSTKVDGRVTAKTAQDTDITVSIEQAGDNVSKVCVRVGTGGDPAVSTQIIEKIKSNLHWF